MRNLSLSLSRYTWEISKRVAVAGAPALLKYAFRLVIRCRNEYRFPAAGRIIKSAPCFKTAETA